VDTKTGAVTRTMSDVAAWVLCLAALTAPWGVVTISGLQLVDVFLVIALAAVALDPLGRHASLAVPKWVTTGAVAVILVMVWHGFVSTATANPYFGDQTSPLLAGGKWLVALLVLPSLMVAVGQREERYIRRVALSWLTGVAASASVAVADYLHFTAISLQLLGYENISGRQSGLSTHPNNLGVACALALPLALMLLEHRLVVGSTAVLLLLAGALASGSRGAQAGSLLALMLTLIAVRRSRRILTRLGIAAGLVLFALLTFWPGRLTQILPLMRFSGPEASVAESDQARSLVFAQARIGFESHPIAGIGIYDITSAHNIFLRLLSAGGLILFIGFVLYIGGALRAVWRLRRARCSLAPYLLAAVLTWMAVGFVENQLTDRYLYIPVGCIAALQMIASHERPNGLVSAIT